MSRRTYNDLAGDVEDAYLEALERTGKYNLAAKETGVSARVAARRRESDSEFLAECEAALANHRDIIYDAARKRAVEGVEKPIIGGPQRNEVVATVRQYSDSLTVKLLEYHDPGMRPNHKIEVGGMVELNTVFDFRGTSKRSRELMRQLLESLLADQIDAEMEGR